MIPRHISESQKLTGSPKLVLDASISYNHSPPGDGPRILAAQESGARADGGTLLRQGARLLPRS